MLDYGFFWVFYSFLCSFSVFIPPKPNFGFAIGDMLDDLKVSRPLISLDFLF